MCLPTCLPTYLRGYTLPTRYVHVRTCTRKVCVHRHLRTRNYKYIRIQNMLYSNTYIYIIHMYESGLRIPGPPPMVWSPKLTLSGTRDTGPYIHACMHASIHTYIPTYLRTYVHTYTRTHVHACMHAWMHTYIHTYIPTYQHTNIPTYIPTYQHTTTTGHRGGDQKNHTTTTGHRGGDQKNHTTIPGHRGGDHGGGGGEMDC